MDDPVAAAPARSSGSGRWALTADLLGVGVVVFPPLATVLAPGPGVLVLILGCAAVLGAGHLFLRRPFGRWPAAAVTGLPAGWRLGYAVAFTGGTSYFTSSAAALLCRVSPLRPWQAVLVVLGGAAAASLARPVPPTVKAGLALLAVLAVPASPPVEETLGSRAAGGVAWLTAAAATVLLAVGWEAVPRRHARPGDVAVVASACCAVATVGYLWSRRAWAGPAGPLPVGMFTAVVLGVFVAGNLRALATFWAPAATGRALATARVCSGLPVLLLALVQQQLFARGWLLLLPAATIATLYCGYALGQPARVPAGAHRWPGWRRQVPAVRRPDR
jgi:hypothetical protein